MSIKCPYCGRWFKNKRSLKTHIRRSHPVEYALFEKKVDVKPPRLPKLSGKKRRKRGGLF